MSAVMESSSSRAGAAAGPGPRPGPRRRHRLPEYVVLGLGLAAALVTMGGFTAVVNQMDQTAFSEIVAPVLLGEDPDRTAAEGYEIGQTLAAWFGTSLVVMLLVSVAGIAHMHHRPHRRAPGWWFLAAGLICLLGSQLILFPIAFLFFVVAGLFALRPISEGSLR